MITLVREKLPNYVHADLFEVQVMTPMRKGVLGSIRLNSILQEFLNPPSAEKAEKEYGETTFRVGDKVMQIRNNYQMEWEIRGINGIVAERGMGVFNGDLGMIRSINPYTEVITVEFEEGKFADYTFKQADELELAYATTIHKAQGSEYPIVVMPVLMNHYVMLQRNLIYTGITRAKKVLVIVGTRKALSYAVRNVTVTKRNTFLKERLSQA